MSLGYRMKDFWENWQKFEYGTYIDRQGSGGP